MPLLGKHIVVTRAVHQAGKMVNLLQAQGAVPLLYPAIAIQPPQEPHELDQALNQFVQGKFDLLVMTSTNTVEILRQRIEALGISLDGLPAAVVGPATAEAARAILGVSVDYMPETANAEALAKGLNMIPGTRVFLPQAEIAEATLAERLQAAGAAVTAVDAYRTVRGQGGVDLLPLLADDRIDAITFTSSSTVVHCLGRLVDEAADGEHNIKQLLDGICIACIGPATAKTAGDAGLTVQVVPPEHTVVGLINALAECFV